MQLSTGLIIAGAYADKVRKVAFAQLREELKKGNITPQTIVRRTAELNRLLYDILVNKLKVDKGDVVRIRIEYDVKDNDIVWKLDTLQIEVFKRLPEEEVRRAVEETIKSVEKVLTTPPTVEEREWTGERVEEWQPSEDVVASVAFIGETESGEKVAAIYNKDGDTTGIVIAGKVEGKTRLKTILIPGPDEAYSSELTVDKDLEELEESEVRELILKAGYKRIEKSEAEKIIKEKMRELV